MNILKTDNFYKNMYEHYKKDNNFTTILKNSGALEEKRTPIDDVMINNDTLLTLPIVVPKTNKKPAIIISTGSFSPLHDGHVESIKLTKELAEKHGYEVTQGIISLSHDGYVNFKNNGISRNHITNRTMLAYKKIEELNESSWLKVDRFEGEAVSIPINFTTVIERTIRLIENYIKKEITVFYTFGSDNAGFSYAFINQNKVHSVCIERKGYINKKIINDINQPQIHYIENKNSNNYNLSSTLIRENNNKIYPVNKIKDDKKPIYLIRGNSVPEEFNNALKKIFEKYIDSKIKIRNYSTTNNKILKGYISLDKFVKGELNIETSRKFELSSFQRKAEGMVFFNNIKYKDFENREFNLIDDDIVSGFTIEQVKKVLNRKNIKISKIETIVDKYIKEEEYIYDVVDSRDFYLNGFKSGLMTIFPNNEVKRMPYIFPFINLTTRANIPAEFQIEFSKDILELNKTLNPEGYQSFKGFFLLDMYNNFLNNK